MLRHLIDPANAITSAGLFFSTLAIFLTLSGRPELGVAAALWALLADHLDGVVAGRTRNRPPETAQIGKNLDSFADLVSGAVFPAVVVMQVSGMSPTALPIAALLLLASALRLSYFNSFGQANARYFTGVPMTYDVPVLAVLFLAAPFVPAQAFAGILQVTLVIVALLHVTPLRVPKVRGMMYAAVTAFAVTSSLVLATREGIS